MEHTISARLSPDEPHAVQRRLASAWLIRCFIDTEARFIWLAIPENCPSEALGFDFDGAAFTHTGDDELLAETEKIFDAFYQAFLGNDA